MVRRRCIGLVSTAACAFAAAPAYATTASVAISGGGLTMSTPSVRVVTGADAACVSGSACTPPVNPVSYPLTASLTGSRTLLFEADPSSGLGAQSIAARIKVPASFRSGLNLNLGLSTPPSPGSSGGAQSPGGRSGGSAGGAPSAACSVDTIVTEGNCPQRP